MIILQQNVSFFFFQNKNQYLYLILESTPNFWYKRGKSARVRMMTAIYHCCSTTGIMIQLFIEIISQLIWYLISAADLALPFI